MLVMCFLKSMYIREDWIKYTPVRKISNRCAIFGGLSGGTETENVRATSFSNNEVGWNKIGTSFRETRQLDAVEALSFTCLNIFFKKFLIMMACMRQNNYRDINVLLTNNFQYCSKKIISHKLGIIFQIESIVKLCAGVCWKCYQILFRCTFRKRYKIVCKCALNCHQTV